MITTKQLLYIPLLVLLIIYGGTFTSCKRSVVITCDTSTLQLEGIGLNDPGYDSVMLIRFDDYTDRAIDTAFMKLQRRGGDTSIVVPGVQQKRDARGKSVIPKGFIYAGWHYMILFPLIQKAYLIDDILLDGQSFKEYTYTEGFSTHTPFRCGNYIVQCRVDTATRPTHLSYNGTDSVRASYLYKW